MSLRHDGGAHRPGRARVGGGRGGRGEKPTQDLKVRFAPGGDKKDSSDCEEEKRKEERKKGKKKTHAQHTNGHGFITFAPLNGGTTASAVLADSSPKPQICAH